LERKQIILERAYKGPALPPFSTSSFGVLKALFCSYIWQSFERPIFGLQAAIRVYI
jgi:hypothetical protein